MSKLEEIRLAHIRGFGIANGDVEWLIARVEELEDITKIGHEEYRIHKERIKELEADAAGWKSNAEVASSWYSGEKIMRERLEIRVKELEDLVQTYERAHVQLDRAQSKD